MTQFKVDLTNPGQVFACCGLFELASRLWPRVTGTFDGVNFVLSQGDLTELIEAAARTRLSNIDPRDKSASPIEFGAPFEGLRLDWWKAIHSPALKPWAGTMLALRIAQAMQRDLVQSLQRGVLDDGHVVYGADKKKVEPFYFDSRRGSVALPLDMGFSSDALSLESVSFPATEFLTLIGLQRFRPAGLADRPRVFQYCTWARPLPIRLAALALGMALPSPGSIFKFENAFRTDQRKHKAFSPAVPVIGR